MGLFGKGRKQEQPDLEQPMAAYPAMPEVDRCSNCGEQKSPYDVFCFECGAPQADYQLPDQTVTEEKHDFTRDFPPTPRPNRRNRESWRVRE